MTQLPWPATHSLLREELLDLPPAIFGDPRLDAPVQALIAGEPQRALALLAAQPPDPRSATALTAWARQLDRNWYPGDVGAETAVVTPDAFVEPQPTDHPVALQLAMLARRGPTDLRTPRTLLEMALRQGTTPGVRQALGYAAQSVDLLTQFATQTGQQAWLPWLTLVRADFSRRAGLLPDADALLAQARQQASYLQSPPRLALTYLTEGDWYAAPGSSPECLGWDLAPLNAPSPLPRPDLTRAATLWDQADALLLLEPPARSMAKTIQAQLALQLPPALRPLLEGEGGGRREVGEELRVGFGEGLLEEEDEAVGADDVGSAELIDAADEGELELQVAEALGGGGDGVGSGEGGLPGLEDVDGVLRGRGCTER